MNEDLKFIAILFAGATALILVMAFALDYTQDRELQRAILAKEHNVSIGVKIK